MLSRLWTAFSRQRFPRSLVGDGGIQLTASTRGQRSSVGYALKWPSFAAVADLRRPTHRAARPPIAMPPGFYRPVVGNSSECTDGVGSAPTAGRAR